MSDDNTANKNYYRRIAAELAETDTPQARYQAVLDRHWEAQHNFDRELSDEYMVGGFLERWSSTPSYSKSRRDADWKVR